MRTGDGSLRGGSAPGAAGAADGEVAVVVVVVIAGEDTRRPAPHEFRYSYGKAKSLSSFSTYGDSRPLGTVLLETFTGKLAFCGWKILYYNQIYPLDDCCYVPSPSYV